MHLPSALQDTDDESPSALLQCYYGTGSHRHHQGFTGAHFDTWDSTGTRAADADRFTADDVVAVSFLSVDVPPMAASALLTTQADEFAALLRELGPDRELVQEKAPWPDDWVGWRLWQKLVALPGIGPTTASKLYARKRPHLRPIYDSVVARVIGSDQLWEPLRSMLQVDEGLHQRLVELGEKSEVPAAVPALRVFDVITWMEGTHGHRCPWAALRP